MLTLTFTEFKKRYDVNFKAKKGDDDFLGQGGYGSVFKGRDLRGHLDVAIKRSPTDKNLLEEVERGGSVPGHTNIARYIEGFRIDSDSEDFDVAILQYYPDNLDKLIAKHKLTDNQLDEILQGILEGLKFLHEGFKDEKGKKIQIIHRDLKPQNILISEYKGKFTPLISDFGISKTIHQEDIVSTGGGVGMSGDAGTIVYKAPEQIKGGTVRTNLDLWAFGVMLFKILKTKLPFYSDLHPSTDAFKLEVMKQITDADLEDIFTQLTDQPQKYQDIIKRCLVRDNKQRVQTAAELIELLQEIPQRLAKAKKLQDKHQYEQALALYEAVLDDNPQLEEAKKGKATCLEKIKEVAEKPKPRPEPPTDQDLHTDGPIVPKIDKISEANTPIPISPDEPLTSGNWFMWPALAAVIGLGIWYFSTKKNHTEPGSTVSTPTVNADSLFMATKTEFLDRGLDKTKAFKQFKKAVAIKPALANDAYQVFMDKANSLKTLGADGTEYEQLANEFK